MLQAPTQERTYVRRECVVFLKTKEAYGGLSNMAGGFPLIVNGVAIRTSEALYQACRFPHLPEVQHKVIRYASPMRAKMVTKPYRANARPDWDNIRVAIMRWALRVKLAQNWETFGDLLRSTGARPIVEQSRRDAFWGAKPVDDDLLVGTNALGRLLLELRAELVGPAAAQLRAVEPLDIPNFSLLGAPIGRVGDLGPAAPLPGDDGGPAPTELEPFGVNIGAAERSRSPDHYITAARALPHQKRLVQLDLPIDPAG